MRIALLQDDVAVTDVIQKWLDAEGYQSQRFSSSTVFLKNVSREPCDLLIVGLRASDPDSLAVLTQIREQLSFSMPVLGIVASGQEQEVVAALRAGADDCMAQPLRQAEFLARVDALARRASGHTPRDIADFGSIRVDLKNRVILRNGRRVQITPKSYDLAVFMFNNLGQLLSRSYLMERIWGRGSGTSTRTLDTHVSRLRSDLGLTPENGWQLVSVYQHGYRLEKLENGVPC